MLPNSPSRVAALLLQMWIAAVIAAPVGAQSQGFSVEGCIGCHAGGEPAPVSNINSLVDLHYVDLDPAGPATASGYRQLNVTLTSVDVTGTTTIADFIVTDENGAAVPNVFDSDGTLVIAKLVDGVDPMDPDTAGDPTEWLRLVSEGFASGGVFQYLGGGAYRFDATFDPTTVPIAAGDTIRAAIEISASDIPAGNGWCDFDADLAAANDCVTPTSLTRDIVRTDTCNGCHGVTSDTHLSFHRNGGRTQVEYCVVCHNPDRNPVNDMTTLAHKIHYGSQLTQPWLDGAYDHVGFTRDIDNCTSCHEPGPADADNWKTQPYNVVQSLLFNNPHRVIRYDVRGADGPQRDRADLPAPVRRLYETEAPPERTCLKTIQFVHHMMIPPGGRHVEELHTHPDAEEIVVITAGSGTALIGTETHEVTAGDVAHIPPAVEHELRNTGDDFLGVLFINVPTGEGLTRLLAAMGDK